MRIYIVGSVAGGKTTLARRLASALGLPHHELDNIVWERIGDRYRQRTPEEQLKLFHECVDHGGWVIEDMGREIFEEGLVLADVVVLLKIGRLLRNLRILTRWIRQRMGLEECYYKPDLFILKVIARDAAAYDQKEPLLRERLSRYDGKLIVLRNRREIDRFVRATVERQRAG